MDKINLEELGVSYTVLNRETNETSYIRVIDYSDLKNVLGEYAGADYTNLRQHIEHILQGFKGFVRSPYDITWYAARKDDFELSHAIIQANAEKNHIVVVEVLPEDDLDIIDFGDI